MVWIDFLREKTAQILTFLVMFVVFIFSFWLWHLPIAALLNASFLAAVIFVIYLSFAFFRWRRKKQEWSDWSARLSDLTTQINELELAEKEHADMIRLWSHQMKVPLAALDLMSQTEISKENLHQQVFSLENYLNLLLEYLRIKNLSTDFRFEEVSALEEARKIVRKYSSFFIAKDLTVNLTGDFQLITDKKWFALGLEQLISNAVKYTNSGQISIEMTAEKLVLTDTGIGILPEDLPRLFEHGFTGFNGREAQQKSSGLGLYLTKLIFDKLNLSISVTSKVGIGTTITIENVKK